MSTLKRISQKISAWLRNREAVRSLILNCALFPSAAPMTKTSFGGEDPGG
jgi:hypothetical protein